MSTAGVESLTELKTLARRIRIEIVKMIGAAGSGHPGGSLSAVELLVALYFRVLRIPHPVAPTSGATRVGHPESGVGHPAEWADRDRFVLSKGHGVPVLYATLAEAGYIDRALLPTLRKLGSPLQGHPDKRLLPVLEASTGSLGQGLSIGIGMALAARMDHRDWHTFVMVGDGEIQEGQIWEAAMFAGFHKLANLTVIVDNNRQQLDGFVSEILDPAPVGDKFRSFGWHVIEINGHDLGESVAALTLARSGRNGRPTAIVAHTVKGKGVSFMENNPEWHGVAPKKEQVEAAIKELEAE